MIDKNKPLLAVNSAISPKPNSINPRTSNHNTVMCNRCSPKSGSTTISSRTLLAFLVFIALVAVVWIIQLTATPTGNSESTTGEVSGVAENRWRVSKPFFSIGTVTDEQRNDLDSIFDQCLQQMMHGPSTQAKLLLEVQQPNVHPVVLEGHFYNLGQASGLSKSGLQLLAAKNGIPATWVWQISRGKTCLKIGPLLGNNRQVVQQPAWLNTTTDQFQQQNDSYGSPISLLQWAKLHFNFVNVSPSDSAVIELVGQLRPNIAQSWGDGTHLTKDQLQQLETDRAWLAEHVNYPLPHEVRFRFSNQSDTARSLLRFEVIRFQKTKESNDLLKSTSVAISWSEWELAPYLSPADFPIQLDVDQTAGRASTGSVLR